MASSVILRHQHSIHTLYASRPAGSPGLDVDSSPPWASLSIPTYKSHRPGSPRSTLPPAPDYSPPPLPIPDSPHTTRSSATFHPSRKTALPFPSPPAKPQVRCPPPCSAAAPPDTPDPAAHTPLQLSGSPTAPPPSPAPAPRRWQLACLASLPASANDVPADSPAGSIPYSSNLLFQIPPPQLPDSSPPAPRTTRVCTSPLHTR